jgi:hypothetical protein
MRAAMSRLLLLQLARFLVVFRIARAILDVIQRAPAAA